jgi:hypothetical protein
VNRPAIDDLLGTILYAWYQTVAAWEPPGQLTDRTCDTCSTSLLAEAVDISVWPHELMHALAGSLGIAVQQITQSRADDGCCASCTDDERGVCAITLVRASIIERRADLLDVLTECVEPTLEEYLATETARGLLHLTEWTNGSSDH